MGSTCFALIFKLAFFLLVDQFIVFYRTAFHGFFERESSIDFGTFGKLAAVFE